MKNIYLINPYKFNPDAFCTSTPGYQENKQNVDLAYALMSKLPKMDAVFLNNTFNSSMMATIFEEHQTINRYTDCLLNPKAKKESDKDFIQRIKDALLLLTQMGNSDFGKNIAVIPDEQWFKTALSLYSDVTPSLLRNVHPGEIFKVTPVFHDPIYIVSHAQEIKAPEHKSNIFYTDYNLKPDSYYDSTISFRKTYQNGTNGRMR